MSKAVSTVNRTMQIPIQYAPIDQFYFKWRFAEDAVKYTMLTPDELKDFRPLCEESSKQLWTLLATPVLRQFRANHERTMNEGTALPSLVCDSNWTPEEESQFVRSFLTPQLDFPEGQTVYFSWDPDVAVMTTWGLLLRHWTDFCYPSDFGNIAIPMGSACAIVYWEEHIDIVSRDADGDLLVGGIDHT